MDDKIQDSLAEKFYEDRVFKSLECRGSEQANIEFYNCTFHGCPVGI